ncbi:MAG: peptidoglycan-binding protein [Lachnospiraceae bacterium]|nr:peptidoglycan-binding protein [Lachnospiraceae bacterium]
MATQTQIKKFIDTMAPIAQKAYGQFGKPLPSVCIAMAAVECAWGTAGSCKHNSYLGQKVGTGKTATKYWSGKSFNSRTQEVVNQSTGQLVTIKDNFRAYDTAEQCIFNYYELLNTSLYKKVLAGSGYKEQIQQIKTCGYMTSVTEVNSCIRIIGQYNLTQYDTCLNGKEDVGSEVITADFNPFKEPTELIRNGSRGEGARWVQWHLWRFGLLDKSGIDGIIGVKSEAAVKEAQRRLGIKSDGIVGPDTKSAFKNVLAN